jgi:hypothetical protein
MFLLRSVLVTLHMRIMYDLKSAALVLVQAL